VGSIQRRGEESTMANQERIPVFKEDGSDENQRGADT